jgi:replicative DNA helicase
MSNIKDEVLKFIEDAEQQQKRKDSVVEKELILRERKADNQLEILKQNDKELELAKTVNFGGLSEAQIQKLQTENTNYFDSAQNKLLFINKTFDGKVPFFKKNLILIGAESGYGKSTTVANIIATTMRQRSSITGKMCKILVISNEENSEDVYNRVCCLAKNWHYVNHDKFTKDQRDSLNKYIPLLAKDGWLTVIDDHFGSTDSERIRGMTSTIEGIETIFENLIRDKIHYDCILIDYYQNISSSKKNPSLNNWQVQERVAAMLDKYKNVYPAPIVLLAQLSPQNEERTVPFKVRIEGRKIILNVATCSMEMVRDIDNLRTEWIVHKSRFNNAAGMKFHTGYNNGRFVEYDEKFKLMAQEIKERKSKEEMDRRLGIESKQKMEEKLEEENEN